MIAASFILLFPSQAKSVELIVGFQNTQPKYLIKDNRLSGLCFDIYRKIESRLKTKNIVFNYPSYYTPLKRIFSDMEMGKTHLYCGAGKNNKRTEKLIYSDIPLYEVKNLIVSRADDATAANSLDDLVRKASPVIALLGSSTEKYLRNHNVPIEPISPTSATHALKLVQKSRARYFVYHDIGIRYHIKENFSDQDFKFAESPVRRYDHYMVLSPHISDKAISDINHAIRQLSESGDILSIMKKYQ
ncbi:MAG: transporter substrate-binding domain-containing protein [Sneathiella sp.]|nr:transporter substrate-binding domain-containing protein [Sneathiella sp.]